jgi:hypothetical protein
MRIAAIERDPVFGCWLWLGTLDRDGYPMTDDGKRAHRVVYEREVGPIPAGHELDHECRRRRCVAPNHAEPVDRGTNEKRKSWRTRVRRATCKRGHDMRVNAMITPEGGRVCRSCR